MRGHWRQLGNVIELVLPSAHRSPQPKWQIDRFSHFWTAYRRVSLGKPGHVLSPNNSPLAWGIWAPSNTCFFGPTQVHNPNGISIGSAVFALLTAERPYTSQWATPFPLKIAPSNGKMYTHPIHDSLGPSDSLFSEKDTNDSITR